MKYSPASCGRGSNYLSCREEETMKMNLTRLHAAVALLVEHVVGELLRAHDARLQLHAVAY